MAHKCINIEDKRGMMNDNPYAYVIFFALLVPIIAFVPGTIFKLITTTVAWVFSQFFIKGTKRDALIKTIFLMSAPYKDATIRDSRMYDPELVPEIKSVIYNPKRAKKKIFLE